MNVTLLENIVDELQDKILKEDLDQAVEFIKNCIAVVDDTGTLKALWLKPKYD